VTALSPERAVYEAFQRAFPAEDWGPWELLSAEDREGWQDIAKGGASPELAEAREQLAAVREIASAAANSTSAGRSAMRAPFLARRILAAIGAGTSPEGTPDVPALRDHDGP
jgi:hypothetical protein